MVSGLCSHDPHPRVSDLSARTPGQESLRTEDTMIRKLGTTKVEVEKELENLRAEIERHGEERARGAAAVKDTIRREMKAEERADMVQYMRDRIRIEVGEQVPAQIEQQLIREHLQMSLADHVEMGERVRIALDAAIRNSQARGENARIETYNKDRTTPFAKVVRTDGQASAVWPADLTSLLGYSDETVGRLLDDYELHNHGQKKMNMNSFLAFIGVGLRMH
ncbi:hypothetical protein BC628DRAFT_1359283 [Trametes gibbosa]|nr:hypothetical protein BC628DRAFT_1359283 [Trametes gibbosa]